MMYDNESPKIIPVPYKDDIKRTLSFENSDEPDKLNKLITQNKGNFFRRFSIGFRQSTA